MEPGFSGYEPGQQSTPEQEGVVSPVKKGADWLRSQTENLRETALSVVSNDKVEAGRIRITVGKVGGALTLAAGMYLGSRFGQDQNLIGTLISYSMAQAGASELTKQSALVRAWREQAKKENEGEDEPE